MNEGPWAKDRKRAETVSCNVIPIGAILTMAGTGSKMNGGAVITNPARSLKLVCHCDMRLFPQVAILNPRLTCTLPHSQVVSGCFDIMSHILEQYFSDGTTTPATPLPCR